MHSKTLNINNLYPVVWVATPVAVIVLILLPGLTGPFLLDDITNLGALGRWADEDVVKRIMLFLADGPSGPTGRPISLMSFLINDMAWPSDPYPFKYTNLLLHLLNSMLILWFCWRLFIFRHITPHRSGLLAMIICILWALHPLQASTIFYVIQRMTILSTTFTLAALVTYLYIKQSLIQNDTRKTAYLTVLLLLFGILGVLSKESAALLPLYIFVTEYFLFSNDSKTKPAMKRWLLIFSIIPSIILLIYLARTGLQSSYATRPFSMPERLYSEAQALTEYLSLIVFPRLHGLGIFHDDFPVTKSLFTSFSAFMNILSVLLIPVLVIYLRKSIPFVAFAIIWFFSGHLLESTVIPLELYFEHRNYLPMLGILIGLVYGAFHITNKYRPLALASLATYTLIISFMSLVTSTLWGDTIQSATVWADEHPDSTRARSFAREVFRLIPSGEAQQTAYQHALYLYDNHAGSAISILQLLNFECETGRLTPNRVNDAIKRIAYAEFYQHFSGTLISLETHTQNQDCAEGLNKDSFSNLLTQMEAAPNFKYTHPWAKHLLHHMQSRIYFRQRNLGMTMASLEKAYSYKPVIDIRLEQARYLLTAGLYHEAQTILNKMRGSSSKLDLRLRDKDINIIELAIAAQIKNATNPPKLTN